MSQLTKHLYEFGKFRLDAGERLLLRDGEPVPLTPKAFELLLVLVERHSHLLEKEELLKLVWPDTFVEEANLSYNVSSVRKALEETGDGQRFIETVPKRGYRFVANVKRVGADNPVTEERSTVTSPPEEGRGRAPLKQQPSPRPSPILTGDILALDKPSNDPGFALETLSTPSLARVETTKASALVSRSRGKSQLLKHERWMWIGATALAALTAFGFAWYLARQPPAETPLMNLSILPVKNSSFGHIAISPDGRWLAFTAAIGAQVHLWVRQFDSREANLLPGTQGARLPFWSPDSHHLGFFAGNKLKKIEVPDGLPATLCDVRSGTGGTWNHDGMILFTSLGGAGLSLISTSGGDVTSVIRADLTRETDYKDPSFLPDGRHFLYFNLSGDKEIRGIYLASLDGRVNKRLLGDDSNAVYAESSSGGEYLLFGRQGALMAQPFDTRQLQLTDEPFSVVAQVGRVLGTNARRNFSVSETGVLVLDPLPGRQRTQLVWVDRAGRTNDTAGPQGQYTMQMPRLSPDNNRFIYSLFEEQRSNSDLWLSNLTTGNVTRFTFDEAFDLDAVWSPDGSRIAWCSNRKGQFDLYQTASNGGGKDELLLDAGYTKHPTDWSPDGRFIIYSQLDPKTNNNDVWVLPMVPPAGDRKAFVFLDSADNESSAVLSPDGEWMAYVCDESGRYEVYVESFPRRGGKRQVSTGGGLAPQWRRDGKEMFFHAPDGNLMAVKVKGGPSFEADTPVVLFAFPAGGIRIVPYYSATSDGHRFLLSTIVDTDTTTPLTVLVNWSAGLKRCAPRSLRQTLGCIVATLSLRHWLPIMVPLR